MSLIIVILSLVALEQFIAPTQADNFIVYTPCSYESEILTRYVLPTHYDLSLNFTRGKFVDGRVKILHKVRDNPDHRSDLRKSMAKRIHGARDILNKFEQPFDDEADARDLIILHNYHSNGITKISYKDLGKSKTKEKNIGVESLCRDKYNEYIGIRLAKKLKPGHYGELEIVYESIAVPYMDGVMKNTVSLPATSTQILFNHYLPNAARHLYPSFDEPDIRSTYTLRVLHSDNLVPLSNAKLLSSKTMYDTFDSLLLSEFDLTPPLSTNMFSFAIGDFKSTHQKSLNGKTDVRAYAPMGFESQAKFALDIVIQGLDWMERYFGMEYDYHKLDIAILQNLDVKAFGTTGLITVDESCLTRKENSPQSRIECIKELLREVARLWTGNSMSFEWWCSQFIDEGLATYLGYKSANELFPQMQFDMIQISTLTRDVLDADLNPESLPLSYHESHKFRPNSDIIVHGKSHLVWKMISDFVGEAKFQSAIKKLLEEFRGKSYSSDDFERILDSISEERVSSIFENFLYQRSYPIVEVSYESSNNKIKLTQKSVTPEDSTIWKIPIKAIFSNGDKTQEISKVLEGPQDELQPPTWFNPLSQGHFLKLNPNFKGLYLTKYDDILIHGICNAIKDKKILPIDRLHLFIESERGIASDSQLKMIIESFKDEDDTIILAQLGQLISGDPSYEEISNSIYKKIGFSKMDDQNPTSQFFRSNYLKTAVFSNVPSSRSEGIKIFAKSQFQTPVYLRPAIYLAIMKSDLSEYKDMLANYYDRTRNREELNRLFNALALSNDESILREVWVALNSPKVFKIDNSKNIIKLMKTTEAGRNFLQSLLTSGNTPVIDKLNAILRYDHFVTKLEDI